MTSSTDQKEITPENANSEAPPLIVIASNRGPYSFKAQADGTFAVTRGSGGLVTALAALAEVKAPAEEQTAIEAPYRLLLSPRRRVQAPVALRVAIELALFVLAGAHGMSWKKFMVLDFFAALSWLIGMFVFGYLVGEPAAALLELYSKVANYVAVALVVGRQHQPSGDRASARCTKLRL